MENKSISRRKFLGGTVAITTAFAIVPRHVLGGPGYVPPSEIITRAVIGTGGRGKSHIFPNEEGKTPVTLAVCDVDANHLAAGLKKAECQCDGYRDFRSVLDRKDIDIIAIATPPHWHSLISIAAANAGKDVLCEKPMTHFIAEGKAVIEAVKRNGRVFQIGTFRRFSDDVKRQKKLVMSGLLGSPLTVRLGPAQGFIWKVKEWSGKTDLTPQAIPPDLDYDLWLGPAPIKPYHPHRVHRSFRGYWDYDGGGLSDMGQHYLDPVQYILGKDDASPVQIEATALWPTHPDAVGLWGTIKMIYEDGTTLILNSAEWGDPEPKGLAYIEGPKGKLFDSGKTEPAGLLEEASKLSDPPKMFTFDEAVRLRQQPGGHEDSSHRSCSLMHLANIAIRTGRKLRWDPVTETFPGDEEANRLVNLPMRAPWHL